MSDDKGTVSTEDAPPARNAISVVTEENQDAQAPKATPPVDDGQSQSNDAQATSSETQDNEDPPKPKKRNRRAERERRALRKQIEQATAKADAAESENAELRQRLDALEAKLDAGPKREKPKLADYDDPDKFAADYKAWEDDQKPTRKTPAKKAPADSPPKKANDTEQVPEEIKELHTLGKERFGDEFAEVIGQDDLPLSQHMVEYIFDADLGPELVMWADENREEAEKIYRMGPVRAVKALDKVVSTLSPGEGDRSGTIDVKEDKQTPPNRKVSKAKEPPSDGVKTSTADTGDSLEGLSMDDYAAKRRAQERKNRM